MATVWLKRRGWEDGDVPDVCMKCGRPAPDRVKKTFTWMPSWVYLLILVNLLVLLVVALCVRQTRRALIPLCDGHKNHWRWRNLFAAWSFALLAAANVLFGVATTFLADPDDVVVFICGAAFLSLIGWLITIAIVQSGAIRAHEFAKNAIRLTNVSEEFKEAYEDEFDREETLRYGDKDLIDRTVRERWNQGSRRPTPDETRNHVRKEASEEDVPPGSDKYHSG